MLKTVRQKPWQKTQLWGLYKTQDGLDYSQSMAWLKQGKKSSAHSVTLVIIYNHYFPQNIERLQNLYSNRFSSLVHVMPFATKEAKSWSNVIPVFESSHYFSGFVAQVSHELPRSNIYLFVADDALLNPAVSEKNITEFLGLKSGNFIPVLRGLGARSFWPWANGASKWSPHAPGLEVAALLPSKDDAISAFEKHGLTGYLDVPASVLEKAPIDDYRITLDFPLATSWSDVFVVNEESLEEFSRLCGIFASTKLFVEVAIPTAMVLSCQEIQTSASSPYKPRAVWTPEEKKQLEGFRSPHELFESLPTDTFCIHPVKVSRWV